jgi:hypothetical protein
LSEREHISAPRAAGTSATRRRTLGEQPFTSLQRNAGNRAVQRLASHALHALDGDAISARIGAAESTGGALDSSIKQRLSEALGADPGEIRIHADSEADELSQALGAKAFTSGQDIFFRSGTFDPSTPEGFGLLVHESTHVLQQAAGPVAGSATADGALAISDPGDAFEQAASSTAAGTTPAGPSADSRSVQRESEAAASMLAARPVQRDFGLDDLVGAAEQSQQPVGPLGGMINSFSGAISDDAASGNLGMGTLTKAAKAEEARESAQGAGIRSSEKEFDSDVDAATSYLGGGAGVRFAGGAAKELWGMGAGLDSIVQNPLGFQKAQAAKAEKEAVPMATNQYFDSLGKVSRGEEGLGDAASDIFGAFSKGKDNELAAKQAAAQPAIDDINKGDYAGALGHVGAQVGVAVLSLGEEGPLGELGAEASAGEKGAAVASEEAAAGSEAAGARGFTPRDPLPHPLDAPLPAEAPDVRIVPRNPELGVPGGDGFFEQADPFADTKRFGNSPPTERGIGPEFTPADEPPVTRPEQGPPKFDDEPTPVTERDPVTQRDPLEPADSPLAKSVDGSQLPGLQPADSPLAKSVDGSKLPGLQPAAEPVGPVSEPAPVSESPITVDSKRLGDIEGEFEKAWEGFSDLPFERGLLPT